MKSLLNSIKRRKKSKQKKSKITTLPMNIIKKIISRKYILIAYIHYQNSESTKQNPGTLYGKGFYCFDECMSSNAFLLTLTQETIEKNVDLDPLPKYFTRQNSISIMQYMKMHPQGRWPEEWYNFPETNHSKKCLLKSKTTRSKRHICFLKLER